MIIDVNRKVSIIAYYISKFDMDAVHELGYDSYSTAFFELSNIFGKNNNYIRLRRDEFDPLIGKSNRQGWNKRTPKLGVVLMHNDLKNYTFEELSLIVKDLIAENSVEQPSFVLDVDCHAIIEKISEEEYERIINMQDPTAALKRISTEINVRQFNTYIPNQLKKIYQHRCQICGATAEVMYGVDVSEAHHIQYFTQSFNNNANNIIILCPDHHRIVHKAHAVFNYSTHCFEYENAHFDALLYNIHL